ncbi:MAG: 5'/3'-nucleotidase SurE, partial [Paludibacter sp.]
MNKPLILITNDDGADAKGINVLTQLMMQIGDVVVVA